MNPVTTKMHYRETSNHPLACRRILPSPFTSDIKAVTCCDCLKKIRRRQLPSPRPPRTYD